MLTLDALRADTYQRRVQLTQFPNAPNPPTWSSFTSSGTGFQVVLIPPTIDNASASGANTYLPQGVGSDFPSTGQNQQNQSTASINTPTFLYQVQIATDSAFTLNVQTFDMGTSLTTTIPSTGAQFAQARCKFVNSPYSAWRPFAGTSTNGPTYRPFQFTSVGGAATTSPFKAMDGDLNTFAVVNGNGAGASTIFQYGPYGPSSALTNGLTLTVITQVNNVDGGTSSLGYSVDAGGSFTNIFTVAGARAKTTDTVTLPNNYNIALTRIQLQINSGLNTINVYETFIQ
jgi:hypothetical protein